MSADSILTDRYGAHVRSLKGRKRSLAPNDSVRPEAALQFVLVTFRTPDVRTQRILVGA
jgi:hypothetical protein